MTTRSERDIAAFNAANARFQEKTQADADKARAANSAAEDAADREAFEGKGGHGWQAFQE